MSITVIKNACLYTPSEIISHGAIVIEREKIGFVGPESDLNIPSNVEVIDADGKNICPGFIDIHTHGAKGIDFLDADAEGINQILSHYAHHGTTSYLATTMSAAHEKLMSTCEKLGRLSSVSQSGPEILGIHLEGPYINREKRGVHNIEAIRPPAVEEFREYQSYGPIKILTLAPELPGAEELIAECTKSAVVPAVAHSCAGFDVIQKAKAEGLSHATHFFNTVPGFHHRQPGVVGAVLDDADFTVELIADGVHLHPATLRLMYRVKGADKIILASDSSPFSGLEPGQYRERNPINVSSKAITTSDGTLAGSNLTMIQAVQNMVNFTGCTLSDAIRMATINPAKLIGVDQRKGSLEPGKDADLVLFEESFNITNVFNRGKETL